MRELGRRFLGARDMRSTNMERQIHNGASGLIYSAIYNAPDVFSYLFEFEWQLRVENPILYMFEGFYYYLAAESNVLHCLV